MEYEKHKKAGGVNVNSEVLDAERLALKVEQDFLNYASNFDTSNGRIHLKMVHTLQVVKVMKWLTGTLHLPKHQRCLAHIIAMYHDIGRFEQVRRFDTFFDAVSIDHAELGCEVLAREHLLQSLPLEDQRKVITAIRNHNRFVIEDGLDDETLVLCRLIRDADKCDIFRVFACEDMVDTMGETEAQVASERISPKIYQAFLENRCVDKRDRQSGLDIWLTYLGFVFDLNYDESIVFLRKQGYYRQPFDRNTFTDKETAQQVQNVLASLEQYMDGRLLPK